MTPTDRQSSTSIPRVITADPGGQSEQEPDGFHCDGTTFDDCEACAKGWCGFPDQHCEHRTRTYDERDDFHDPAEDHCTHCGCCTCNSCAYGKFA
jgi:hypothetical protein